MAGNETRLLKACQKELLVYDLVFLRCSGDRSEMTGKTHNRPILSDHAV